MKGAALLVLSSLHLAGCRSSGADGHGSTSAGSLVARRPFALDVPAGYDAKQPAPLLLALHGYGETGDHLGASSFDLSALASARGAFVAHPDGTPDSSGRRFWSATDACCNFAGADVDDVAYLSAVVADVARRYAIDPKRVWIVGLSNGGFMAHRLACDRSDTFAAIVSVAGATWSDPARCQPKGRVSLLEVHSTDDPTVRYEGAASVPVGDGAPYPSVDATVAATAANNGCSGALAAIGLSPGFDAAEPALETEMARWTGCPPGVAVERWRVLGRRHLPPFTRAWSEAVFAWLTAHPKVAP